MQQAAPRTRQPDLAPLNPWPARILLLTLWAGALLAVAAIVMAVVASNMYRETILPGVSAMGVPLGGLTEAEAAARLRERATSGSGAIFTLRDGDQTWQFTAEQLGVSLDADAAAS